MPEFATPTVPLACIILLVTAGCTDLTRRIIPNGLIVAATVTGLIYHLLETPTIGHGFIVAVSGLLAGGSLLLLPYRLAWTGAGDVKLLAALGTWLGPLSNRQRIRLHDPGRRAHGQRGVGLSSVEVAANLRCRAS